MCQGPSGHRIEPIPEISTRGVEVSFGKYAGRRWAAVPGSYLSWMVRTRHSREKYALAEIARRGKFNVEPDRTRGR